MKERILLFGAGGHGESVAGVIEAERKYTVAGLVDSVHPVGSTCFGYEVLGREENLLEIIDKLKITKGLVCVGDNYRRKAFAERIRKAFPDFEFITSIHPSAAVCQKTILGPGTVVMAQAAVNRGCRVGDGCIINTKASLDHNSVMEDYSSLAPGVTTGGWTIIGACSAVGLGANVLDKINIGDNVVIGAGSLVNRDIGNNVIAYGSPADVIRNRKPDEPYLR